MGIETHTHDMGSRDSLKGKDYVFEKPPEWLPTPLQNVAMDLTYNEAHAAELGLVGFLAGTGAAIGYWDMVGVFTAVVVAWSFGLNALVNKIISYNVTWTDSPARKLISSDPWYFLVVYVLTSSISYLIVNTIQ